MKISNILIVYTYPKNAEEKSALRLVKDTLKRHKINYDISDREKLNKKLFKNKDLIIAVGGDGTFIRASHFIFDKTPLMGVNSDPRCKEGFFMTSEKKDFEKKFKKVLNNEHSIQKIHRLEAYIGKKKVSEFALNEFYIASKKPYHTTIYAVNINGKTERQKSSGVLVSTAAGSHAWIKSAGGKIMPLGSSKFEYLVREPYYGRTCAKCDLCKGILDKNEKIEIVFNAGKGVLVVDSLSKEHMFKAGQKVTVKMSQKPLYRILFGTGNISRI